MKYSTNKAKATGHSLGAALAYLAAMDLLKAGYDVNLYNFGQPRVGNDAYALYANKMITEQYRHTHYKDIVPHVPGDAMGFKHSIEEVYEDVDGKLTFCSTTDAEDKTCSDQFHSWQLSADYHCDYLGTCICGDCGQCATSIKDSSNLS